MAAAFDTIEAAFGGIDVVVNTAGIMLLSPIATLNLADLDRMHRTNIRGTFVVSQLAANRLRPAARSSTSPPRSPGRSSRPTAATSPLRPQRRA